MRARKLVLLSSLTLVLLAGQATVEGSQTKLDPPVVAACAVQGWGCDQPTLDGGRQSVVSHHALAGACAGEDLHVMKYVQGNSEPLVATWCS